MNGAITMSNNLCDTDQADDDLFNKMIDEINEL